MNLHEYQGKSILKSFGVAIQEGIVANNASEALQAAKDLNAQTGTEWFVVKAQIHAGGRGKGVVTETGSHGVVLAKGEDKVEDIVNYRNKSFSSAVTGSIAPIHHTKWIDAMDDSMNIFLKTKT